QRRLDIEFLQAVAALQVRAGAGEAIHMHPEVPAIAESLVGHNLRLGLEGECCQRALYAASLQAQESDIFDQLRKMALAVAVLLARAGCVGGERHRAAEDVAPVEPTQLLKQVQPAGLLARHGRKQLEEARSNVALDISEFQAGGLPRNENYYCALFY